MKVNKKPRAVSLEFHAKYLGEKVIQDLLISFVFSAINSISLLQDYSA